MTAAEVTPEHKHILTDVPIKIAAILLLGFCDISGFNS